MASKNSLASSIMIGIFILLATIGSSHIITNEFISRGGWMSIGYALVTAVFVVISINIFLLFSSAASLEK